MPSGGDGGDRGRPAQRDEVELGWSSDPQRNRTDADAARHVQRAAVLDVGPGDVPGIDPRRVDVAGRQRDLAAVGMAGEREVRAPGPRRVPALGLVAEQEPEGLWVTAEDGEVGPAPGGASRSSTPTSASASPRRSSTTARLTSGVMPAASRVQIARRGETR